MEKCLLFEKLEASLAYCSVSYDDQLPHIQVCHFLCKNNIGNIGKGKQECFGTTETWRRTGQCDSRGLFDWEEVRPAINFLLMSLQSTAESSLSALI